MKGKKDHPCYNIVSVQANKEEFLLPEPWNGDIKTTKILVISSNPSIDEMESFPTNKWEEGEIEDFFNNRFDGKKNMWVKDNKYILLKNGEYSKQYVRFWSHIKARCEEIYGKDMIKPGKDFCLIEVVRCKSRDEIGVKEAQSECSLRYLKKSVQASGAEMILCVGSVAIQEIRKCYNLQEKGYIKDVDIEGKTRKMICIPHPNARGEKKIEKVLGREILEEIKGDLGIS